MLLDEGVIDEFSARPALVYYYEPNFTTLGASPFPFLEPLSFDDEEALFGFSTWWLE